MYPLRFGSCDPIDRQCRTHALVALATRWQKYVAGHARSHRPRRSDRMVFPPAHKLLETTSERLALTPVWAKSNTLPFVRLSITRCKAARTGAFIGIRRWRGRLPFVSTKRNQFGLTSTSRPLAGRNTDKPLKFTFSIFSFSNSVCFRTRCRMRLRQVAASTPAHRQALPSAWFVQKVSDIVLALPLIPDRIYCKD